MTLKDFILAHAERGPCMCGQCADAPANPEFKQPTGHTADIVFFKVHAKDNPLADELRALIATHKGEHRDVDLFDGKEHNYFEVGAMLGDQGLALLLMGLGSILGLWKLLTPRTVLGNLLPDEKVMPMVRAGFISIQTA